MRGRPLSESGEAVHLRTMSEGRLSGGDIFFLPAPDVQRCGLQSASVRKGQLPRRATIAGRADLVDRIEVRGGVLVGLPARKKRNTGHASRYASLEAGEGFFGDFIHAGLLRAVGAGDDHIGFEDRAFEMNALHAQLSVCDVEHGFGDARASVDVVAAIHEDFGLNDGDDSGLLAERGVARERVGVGLHAGSAGDMVADFDDGAPF